MALLSDGARKRPAKRSRMPAPALEAAGDGVRLTLRGAKVTALPDGALWLEGSATLIVSDLHLEKGTALARGGHRLPPYDTRTTLQRVGALLDALSPKRVISLGDSFHDGGGAARLDAEDRLTLSAMIARTDWIWVEGNHDPAPPADLGGRAMAEVDIDGLIFRHEPIVGAAGEIAGHLHPCARVVSRSGSVRRRCFATDGERLVMPAFGAYAGGLNVCDEAFAALFPQGCYALMLGRARVYPAAPGRLVGD